MIHQNNWHSKIVENQRLIWNRKEIKEKRIVVDLFKRDLSTLAVYWANVIKTSKGLQQVILPSLTRWTHSRQTPFPLYIIIKFFFLLISLPTLRERYKIYAKYRSNYHVFFYFYWFTRTCAQARSLFSWASIFSLRLTYMWTDSFLLFVSLTLFISLFFHIWKSWTTFENGCNNS